MLLFTTSTATIKLMPFYTNTKPGQSSIECCKLLDALCTGMTSAFAFCIIVALVRQIN